MTDFVMQVLIQVIEEECSQVDTTSSGFLKSRLTMPTGQSVVVAQGDLTDYKVDAIVNAANPQMVHSGGIAKAIVDKGNAQSSFDAVRHVGSYCTTIYCTFA